jgi:hypothetical protein
LSAKVVVCRGSLGGCAGCDWFKVVEMIGDEVGV